MISSGSSSNLSLRSSSISNPSSSSFRFLLGLESGGTPFDFGLFDGRASTSSSLSKARFREVESEIGEGFRGGLAFVGGIGRGDGRISEGPSCG